MDVSSYVLLSQETALRRRLDVAANNMANMSTVGFKREAPVFHEYVENGDAAPDPAKKTSYVLDYGTIHDTRAGAFQATNNPLDVMIDGPGYLSVEASGGSTAYTRAGFIHVSEAGELVTAAGQRILGEGGKPITVSPEDAGALSIGADGTVKGKTGALGRIAVTTFGNEASVNPRGDGLYDGQGGTELPAAQTKLRSGGVEGSNVDPIVETTDMVEILRAYQTSQHLADSMNDLRKNALTRLSKIS